MPAGVKKIVFRNKTKHVMTGPTGNREFCLTSTLGAGGGGGGGGGEEVGCRVVSDSSKARTVFVIVKDSDESTLKILFCRYCVLSLRCTRFQWMRDTRIVSSLRILQLCVTI